MPLTEFEKQSFYLQSPKFTEEDRAALLEVTQEIQKNRGVLRILEDTLTVVQADREVIQSFTNVPGEMEDLQSSLQNIADSLTKVIDPDTEENSADVQILRDLLDHEKEIRETLIKQLHLRTSLN